MGMEQEMCTCEGWIQIKLEMCATISQSTISQSSIFHASHWYYYNSQNKQICQCPIDTITALKTNRYPSGTFSLPLITAESDVDLYAQI